MNVPYSGKMQITNCDIAHKCSDDIHVDRDRRKSQNTICIALNLLNAWFSRWRLSVVADCQSFGVNYQINRGYTKPTNAQEQTTGTTNMNRILRAIALSLMATTAGVATARASMPLTVIERTGGAQTLAPMLRQVMPAVVSITVRMYGAKQTGITAQDRRDARRPSDVAVGRASSRAGSGVVFDAAYGFIVTNNHVIDRADEIKVTLADGRTLPATLVGADPETDLAVIKVQSDRLTAIKSGDSGKLEIGDFVLAIGNPNNIGETVTSGIVGGLHRNSLGIVTYEDFIQTDAAIYPGNSGGALINLQGELVGINAAFIGSSNTNSGMGFAIPANMVRDVVDHILEFGNARRGKIGITYDDPTPALARDLKLPLSQTGSVITRIDAGSPAEHAGLIAGDVVTELARKPVRNTAELRTRLGLLWAGDTAEFTVLRRGVPMTIQTVIGGNERKLQSN